jgi:hypothetical protein
VLTEFSVSVLPAAFWGLPDVVYRGVYYSDELLDLYADNIGETVYLYNFISTSRLESVAQRFARKNGSHGTVITINILRGKRDSVGDVQKLSMFPEEQEILIACNAGYRIESVDLKTRQVELTLIDQTKCLSAEPNKQCKAHRRWMVLESGGCWLWRVLGEAIVYRAAACRASSISSAH